MSKIKLIIVAGPTASGKSALTIELARQFNGEIVSADSRQVYRGMDIGTGKVTKREQRLAPHRLLDVASPARQYSVARFVRDARRAIADIAQHGKLPIICGGTGFWIDALVYGQSIPNVPPNAKLRARLRKLSAAQLFSRLQKLDPARAAVIDRHNSVRLIRALEIVLATGGPVPPQRNSSPYGLLYMGVSRPFPELKRRIERRLDARLHAGMIGEVKHLHAQGVSWRRLESFGLEYRWVARFLQKRITRPEMRTGLLHDIIAYAKRQLTWWRKNRDIRWIATAAQAKRLTRQFLRSPSMI